MEELRYAHCDGHTDICYDDSGNHIITCGADGDIRIWNGIEDDDPQSHQMGSSVSAVAFKKDFIYLAADSFKVSAYTFPEAEFDEIVAQFSTAIYHIACNNDGNLIASGGGDFIIKVFDRSSKSLTEFRGHDGPILSLAIDPKEKYLASSGCDGSVRVWLLSNQECVKTLNLFKKSNDFNTSSTLCRLSWSPDGEFLAIPVEMEVHFYQRDTWISKFYLSDLCISKTLSIVTYSPYGKYLAAASMNGQMLVWDVETKKCISRKLHEKELAVCGLAWHPSGKELVFSDIEGQLGLYTSPLNSSPEEVIDTQENSQPASEDFDMNDLDSFIDHDAVEENDHNAVEENDDHNGDDNAFDIGAIKAALEPKIFGEDSVDTPEIEKTEPEKTIQVVEAPKPPIQRPFQPSSTPINLDRRFMLWNNVGIVRCYDTEEENSIDVEFHDANVYHPLHINNTRNHSLAALSTEALLLASPKSDEGASKLECLHFGTWDSNKEWVAVMPENEEIEAIALGDGFAACVTDKKFVRLYTISGIQCEVFLIPGPVVSCAARGNQLLIVFHKGLGIEGDQCLNMMIAKVNLERHSSVKECFLPLSSKAFLSWLGFTDEGTPCIVDSSGIVSLLSISCGVKWIPIADTTANMKSKSNSYFILGLSEIKQEIRCILCKGSKYPSLLPRPNIAVLPFSLPFCEMATDRARLEEENQRHALAHKCIEALLKEGFDLDSELNSIQKKRMDILLKMFALATRSEREFRALNVAELMPNPIAVQGAIRYATQRHRIALAERLSEVMSQKMGNEAEPEEEDDEFDLQVNEDLSTSLISGNTSIPNLSVPPKENSVLKPKPLSRMRSSQTIKHDENSDTPPEIDEESSASSSKDISLLPKSSPHSNPFKSNSKSQAKKPDIGNLNGIDEILNNSISSRNSSGSCSEKVLLQPKKSRFPTKKSSVQKSPVNGSGPKEKFGFDLYLEQNREEIKSSAPPDVSEKELIKIAMKMFKELPKAEKQQYLKSSASNGTTETIKESFENGESSSDVKKIICEEQTDSPKDPSGKRKETEETSEEITPKPKKIKTDKISDVTIRKLTQFAFTKTPK